MTIHFQREIQYFTPDPEATPDSLGVSNLYGVRDAKNGLLFTGEVKEVKQKKIIITIESPLVGLSSTARSIVDTWSLENKKVQTKGGGMQMVIPNTQENFKKL